MPRLLRVPFDFKRGGHFEAKWIPSLRPRNKSGQLDPNNPSHPLLYAARLPGKPCPLRPASAKEFFGQSLEIFGVIFGASYFGGSAIMLVSFAWGSGMRPF